MQAIVGPFFGDAIGSTVGCQATTKTRLHGGTGAVKPARWAGQRSRPVGQRLPAPSWAFRPQVVVVSGRPAWLSCEKPSKHFEPPRLHAVDRRPFAPFLGRG
jgi:hypothetical protein